MRNGIGQIGHSGITLWTRRAALGGALTLASAADPRKPAAQDIEPGELQLSDPRSLSAAVQWHGGDGRQHRLSDYTGQGVVLNFWATWCAPCVAELPSLARLATRLHDDRIVVLPISTDATGAAAVVPFYAAHHIADLGVWLDPRQTALDATGAPGLPTTIIIDRRGREVARVSGPVDWLAATPIVRALCNSG